MLTREFNGTCRNGLICRSWPDLKVLCIGGEGVTANGLILIAKLCQNIQILELDRAPALTKKIVDAMAYVGLQKLELVELNHTSITAEVSLKTGKKNLRWEQIK